jgi:TRAP-type C4-dicarboxylate transport system permease small subunit
MTTLIALALGLLVSSTAGLYFMYRSLPASTREWVETFAKILVTITLLMVMVTSANYLITCGSK